MSTETSLGLLVASVSELTLEVRRLSLEVRSLQLLVEDRLGPRDHTTAGAPVEELRPAIAVAASPDRAPASQVPAGFAPSLHLSASPAAVPAPSPPGHLSDSERRALARRIGQWLRRALDENYRGPSGREENPQASRVYLVARDHQGTLYDPPLLLRSFSAAKSLVKPAGYIGDRVVFVGFPAQWEAAVAAEAAGLQPPRENDERGR